MSSNQFNNNASNKVVINFNNQPTNFDDATMPNLPVQDVPIIETPRIAEAAQTSTLQTPVTAPSVSPMPQSQHQGQPAPTPVSYTHLTLPTICSV